MAVREAMSFAEAVVVEAAARRLRVDLVLRAVTPTTDTRLISRFLGTHGDGGMVLAVPCDKRDEKVFVPAGWDIGMAFESGDLWVQSRTEVMGHCQFPLHPARRVDGLIVRQPIRVLSMRPGRTRRHEVSLATPVAATVWRAGSLANLPASAACGGRLLNWSEGGLCIALYEQPRFDVGARLLIRLRTPSDGQCPLLQGTVKHYACDDNGFWQVGLGDVCELSPERQGPSQAYRFGAAEA